MTMVSLHAFFASNLPTTIPSDHMRQLLDGLSTSCIHIADAVNRQAFMEATTTPTMNVQGEQQKPLDILSNALFIEHNQRHGLFAAMVSEEEDHPIVCHPDGPYLIAFDPLDGSSNLSLNAPVGTIFSITRNPSTTASTSISEASFIQQGLQQVCAGYAIYGPSTMLVITLGQGTHGFTLDASSKTFVLTHPDINIPEDTAEFAINVSNQRYWEPPIQAYVADCLAGTTGPRKKDFNMRWMGAMVADAHRVLMRGGVFLYPIDSKTAAKGGRLRLLYEANPVGWLIEQAGGLASTGRSSILAITPQAIHQRVPVILGSRNEVNMIERYHAQ